MLTPPEGIATFFEENRVSRETVELLTQYVSLLLKWNQRINLIRDAEHVWRRHILDAAQLHSYIADPALPLLDVGSGGGLPGIVLAILGCTDVHLVESDKRKSVFLAEAVRQLQLPVTVHARRLEEVSRFPVRFVTSRACAPVVDLLDMTEQWHSVDTLCLFPKGRGWKQEIDAAEQSWVFTYTPHHSVTDSEGRILLMHSIARRV